MARKIVTVDETTLLLPVAVSNALKANLNVTFSAAATTSTNAATDAAASATQAANSASAAAAPTDQQVAALVNPSGTTATKTAMAALFATQTQLNALQAASASIEDLFSSTVVSPASGVVAGSNHSVTIFTCPFALRVNSVTISFWGVSTAIALSDTNWWMVRVRRVAPGTAAVNIATKTTRATAGTEPIGQSIIPSTPWKFVNSPFSNFDCAADDQVNMIFAPQGSPTTALGPITVTIGYSPL